MDLELPRPSLGLVIATQVLLGLLFLIGVAAIVLLPGISEGLADMFPEFTDLRAPLLAVAIAIIVLALITLAMISLLVHRIHRGAVLTRSSLLWVDVIIATLACGVILVITGIVLIGNAQAGGPFIGLVLVTTCLILVALGCISLVLRSLLRRATLLSRELEEVV